jgi:2-polyprenyl-6-methoxyphenol hydroxylase-like FAD-dependent oxidoreductase
MPVPHGGSNVSESVSARDADVLIVGAGPVGLTIALALGKAGVTTLVLEQRASVRETSRAIGITPASLEILERYGVAAEMAADGVQVRHAVIHGDGSEIARVGFEALPTDYRFILSLPQKRTEEILLRAVERQESVRVLRGRRVTDISVEGGGLRVLVETGGGEEAYRGGALCGCDGKHSTVRELIGARWTGRALSKSFAMADITDETGLGDTAHLYFTSTGSVESFPLPGGVRRWIVQTQYYIAEPPDGLVQELVSERSGVDLRGCEERWRSSFTTERRIATPWARPPIFLAGDAAHLMPPIGGQGMNVGLGDAEHLADLLLRADRRARAGEYERRRRRAFRTAARRSILGMRIGAATGRMASRMRELLIPAALRRRREQRIMAHFAMLASPNRRSPWW